MHARSLGSGFTLTPLGGADTYTNTNTNTNHNQHTSLALRGADLGSSSQALRTNHPPIRMAVLVLALTLLTLLLLRLLL